MSGALKYGPRRRNYLLYRRRNKLRGVKQISPDHHNNITFFFLLVFVFIEILLIYNIVLVSGIQCKLIQLYTCIYTLFQILFHYRLSQNVEYSSLCYTVRLCCLSILFIRSDQSLSHVRLFETP